MKKVAQIYILYIKCGPFVIFFLCKSYFIFFSRDNSVKSVAQGIPASSPTGVRLLAVRSASATSTVLTVTATRRVGRVTAPTTPAVCSASSASLVTTATPPRALQVCILNKYLVVNYLC